MPTRGAVASVQDGMEQTELGNQGVGPCVVAHLTLCTITDIAAVIAEIIGQSGCTLDKGCATVDSGIVHVDAYAAVVHECGHGSLFCGSGVSRQAVGHVHPIVTGVAKVGTLGAIAGIVSVGMASTPESRIVPIFHHLGHGGSHTACHRIAWAELVVGRFLEPLGGQQGTHLLFLDTLQRQAFGQHIPLLMTADILGAAGKRNLLLVDTHNVLHGHRQGIGVECAGQGICQYRAGAVVCCHHHPAPFRKGEQVDSIVVPCTQLKSDGLFDLQGLFQKGLRHGCRFARIDGCGMEGEVDCKQGNDE